jgi:glycosyltransferase involved in cell wall biosynthesis
MRIAQIAPMYEAVPPTHYGGTERVVWCLCEELVRRGHTVTLFASGDSHTSAVLCPTTAHALRRSMSAEQLVTIAPQLHTAMLSEVYQHAMSFDLIHSHCDAPPAFPFARLVATPTVTTMHGRLDGEVSAAVLACYPDAPLVSISHAQRTPLRALALRWVGTVPNGIALHHFTFQPQAGAYLLFVGRICPEKRPDWAVEVARRAGLPLKVAAKIDPTDVTYWHDAIAPLFAANHVEFVGEVNEQEKAALLADAYATLFPIDWPEPFGLVMAESLACGTPVIAMCRGAVPEVLVDGVSGFVCESVAEMVAAVARVPTLDRTACRREAERFGMAAMTDGYERVYAQLVAQQPPRGQSRVRAAATANQTRQGVTHLA